MDGASGPKVPPSPPPSPPGPGESGAPRCTKGGEGKQKERGGLWAGAVTPSRGGGGRGEGGIPPPRSASLPEDRTREDGNPPARNKSVFNPCSIRGQGSPDSFHAGFGSGCGVDVLEGPSRVVAHLLVVIGQGLQEHPNRRAGVGFKFADGH